MGESRTFHYEYEDYENGDKNAKTMFQEILEDPELNEIEEINIGCWGDMWEDSCQDLIDGMVEHKEAFQNLKRLYVADVDFEVCEVSWIIQGDYSKLWAALPGLEEVMIKGSTDLELGEIKHANLKKLEIVCGGLPTSIIESVEKAELPELETLILYLGSDGYGFDGSVEDIEKLLKNSNFPKLQYLGIVDSEIQDEVAKAVLNSKYIDQISTLDLSKGTLTDEGGALLLEEVPKHANIKKLDVSYHFMKDAMMKKLAKLPIEVDVDEQNEEEEYDGEIYRNAMLTE